MSRVIDAATYPAVIAAAFAVFGVLVPTLGSSFASYLGVAVGAIAILMLERWRPYRISWRPDQRAVANDTLFLALVQMLLPVIVTVPVALWFSGGDGLSSSGGFLPDDGAGRVWPAQWPIAAQVMLMAMIGDFFRYWMHRAAHKSVRLWQFHAVHHAPKQLYWLNVGRFHPLEKIAQMLVDSLPFVVLGVGEQVLAGYFVFYAVNGFFQHSNCRVRLGVLNQVVAGPELHRWHHSRRIAESDNNYGNNLIIWDTMFGTRLAPKDAEVGELGLLNRDYPESFGAQLVAPFAHGLEKSQR